MTEIFKAVKGFDGMYLVSNLGNVKSIERTCKTQRGTRIVPEKLLSPCKDSSGYLYVPLSINGKHKNCLIHRLVLETFKPDAEGKKQVNHKDGNKLNNCLDNLEWCTAKENICHKYEVLNYKAHNRRKVMCIETGAMFESVSDAEKSTGKTGINHHLNGNRKVFDKHHWKYIE